MSKTKLSKTNITDTTDIEEWSTKPEFIYGGPFVKQEKPSPLLDTATPINLQLQGTFKKSFAYYSLKERMPVILTKVIDYCSREGSKIKSSCGASEDDLRTFIAYVSKLKNDLVTNKKYDLLTVKTADADKWNEWIQNSENSYYFTNTWVFTECYVYRRLREGCELQKSLQNFDYFEEQKQQSFKNSLEPMCVVAEKVMTMLPESEKDKRKADFITLIKLCLWANKCDLSLSMGEQVSLTGAPLAAASSASAKGSNSKTSAGTSMTAVSGPLVDPIQMIIDYKDKLLVDDSGKAADAIVTKSEAMAKAVKAAAQNTALKVQCSCNRLATLAAMPLAEEPEPEAPAKGSKSPSKATVESPPPVEGEEPPKIPCPAKMLVPNFVMYDIVCDNAGYELFADLCFGHFLIAQKLVQKVRFHVKKIPWFVSDVTPADFKYVISQCRAANYNREVPVEPKPDADPEAPPEPPRVVAANDLRALGDLWQAFVDDGTFIVMCEDYWTAPHTYKDMKKYEYNLYRKLQYAVGVMFKGDLNYRKLLGERNCSPYLGFEPALQGFIPAPILAVRTVKADLICGLPKGAYEKTNNIDPKWMTKGDYGVIQFCPKAEALKVAEKPCLDYGTTCFGAGCPIHQDM